MDLQAKCTCAKSWDCRYAFAAEAIQKPSEAMPSRVVQADRLKGSEATRTWVAGKPTIGQKLPRHAVPSPTGKGKETVLENDPRA